MTLYYRHVVDDPVVLVVHGHSLAQLGHLLLVLDVRHVVEFGAYCLALVIVFVEVNLQSEPMS